MPPSLPGAQGGGELLTWPTESWRACILLVAWIRPEGPGRPEEGFPTAAEAWERSGAEMIPISSAPPAP